MSDPNQNKLEQLFHEAADLEDEQRSAFLDRACAGDYALRQAVERLLEHDHADETRDRFLTSPIVRKQTTVNDDDTSHDSVIGLTRPPAPGEDAIPGYQLLELVGSGGMGVVYKARHLGMNRLVAIKMLSGAGLRTQLRERFRTEVEALARFHHPNIVQIYEVGIWQDLPFLVMEYVAGPSLSHRLDGTPLPPSSAAKLIEILARATHAVHSQGIVHRDLKPANILFSVDPWDTGKPQHPWPVPIEDLNPKIGDFGLAKDLSSEQHLTETGQAMGTPSYMAPEQVRGMLDQIGACTDIYALGAMLYELVTGRAPFTAPTAGEIFARLLTEDPLSPARLVPGLSRELETVCLKCLEKDPRRRYASAERLADDLHRYLAGEPISARPMSPLERTRRWCRRQPLAAALLAVAGLLTIALITTILIYDAQLTKALARAEQKAEQEREEIIQLEVEMAGSDLNAGFAFRALLRLSDALRLDEGHPDHEAKVRERIRSTLRQIPELLALRSYEQTIIQSRIGDDSVWAVTAGADGTARIVDVMSGKQIAHDMRHESVVERAEFDPAGRLLATQTRERNVRVWDVAAGREIAPTIGSRAAIRQMAFAPNGTLVIQQADNVVKLWDLKTPQTTTLGKEVSQVWRYSLISDNARIVLTVDKQNRARVLDVATGASHELPCRLPASEIQGAISADGGVVALADENNDVWLWDVGARAKLGEPLRHGKPITHICFSPRAERTLVAGTDGSIHVWSTRNESRPAVLPRHEAAVQHAELSTDGLHVLTIRGDKPQLWNVATGVAETPSLGEGGLLTHVRMAADGRRIVVADSGGTVRVWRVRPAGKEQDRWVILHASELALLAQVMSGERVDESGSLRALARDELLRAWLQIHGSLAAH
jgi:serine/threonine protein kinase